jgi:AraC-like DNA-binding protein
MASSPEPMTFSTSIVFGAVCKLVGLEPAELVSLAGLPQRLATGHGVQVTADEYHALMDAVVVAGKRPDIPQFLGRMMANGAVAPVFFALSCAPDLETGFTRFARYKRVFGPVGMSVRNHGDELVVRLTPVAPGQILHSCLATSIMVFLNEKARSCTAEPLVPKRVQLPLSPVELAALTEDFGVMPEPGDPCLVYRAEDGKRHLVSENATLWSAFEADLDTQVLLSNAAKSLEERVRACLIEAISDQDPSVAFVCERLGRSRSGLLRDLAANGLTFQGILDSTRESMAMRYLLHSDLPIKQIANLLAYRDANAFYRAFKSWTGHTPSSARNSHD